MKPASAFAPVLALVLASCADPIPEDKLNEDVEQIAPPRIGETPVAAQPVVLVPGIVEPSIWREANLEGELGCSFMRGDDVLLRAAANVVSAEGAEALVVIDGRPVELQMDGEGGFNSLQRGATFSGPEGMTGEVEISSSAPIEETPAPAMESPQFTATLSLTQGERSVEVEGIYECGP